MLELHLPHLATPLRAAAGRPSTTALLTDPSVPHYCSAPCGWPVLPSQRYPSSVMPRLPNLWELLRLALGKII
ncbi:conserved hypothetical protein [Ricinus communis]|uniref:Uncharacterized protein n=1 Tax=Ricinus communis TaxID=3988 RepID=B9SCP5_RICCO|nr:conserved hypothetical protein [Ricinus communis]